MPSTYDQDGRVKPHGSNGYEVDRDGRTFYVLHTNAFNWTICEGPGLEFVPLEGYGLGIGFRAAETAIGALIGPPRT